MPFPGLAGRAFYQAMLLPYFTAFTLGYGTRVGGKRHLPMTGPALILSNHQSFLDPMLLGICAYPRKLTFLARRELFKNRFFGPFIRWCGAVPIDQGFGRDGIRAIRDRLEAGEAVVVFPEGERTPDGSLGDLKPGISLLVKNASWPVIPTGLVGAFHAWPRSQKLPSPSPLFLPATSKRLAVHFGEPVLPERYLSWDRDEMLMKLKSSIDRCMKQADSLR